MELISDTLYWLSNGLLIPVTVFLLYFFAKALFMVGSFYGKFITRNKTNVRLNRSIGSMDIRSFLSGIESAGKKSPEIIQTLEMIKTAGDNFPLMEKILGDYRIKSEKELDESKLLVKIGPMLGLMGTLIPMGPALVGLATGDISSMANNMQVAFATTVIGIIIGAVGFITLQIRQRWAADDLNILEYTVDALQEQRQNTDNQ